MLLPALLAFSLLACPPRPVVQVVPAPQAAGQEGTQASPASLPGVVALLVPALRESPALASFRGWPRVVVLPAENRSHMEADPARFTARLTELLGEKGAGTLLFLGPEAAAPITAARDRLWTGLSTPEDREVLGQVDWLLSVQILDPFLTDASTFLASPTEGIAEWGVGASAPQGEVDYMVLRFQLIDSDTAVIAWTRTFRWNMEDG